MLQRLPLFLFAALLFTAKSSGQVEPDSPLFLELHGMDRLLFEDGFNHCELDIVDEVVHADFEFYHDQNGVLNKEEFLKVFEESICSTPDRKPIRILVEDSVRVYPMYMEGELYGAIQQGSHSFHIKEPDMELYATSEAEFSHLWVLGDEGWQLKRALSYDHRSPGEHYGEKFEADFPTKLFDKDDKVLELLAKHRIPSLGIGYINQGVVQQVRIFGQKSAGKPADYQTLYKVASLTKPITAIVTLKLVEKGEWDLDDPLSRYHVDPDLDASPYLDKLTTRHVLSHQSGFPNWRYLSESGELSFEFEPGTKHQYSGEGFEFLRAALEAKFKKPLEELALIEIFEPLRMRDTHFFWHEGVAEESYAVEHDELGRPIPFEKHTEASSAANLLTTVADYGRFMAHVIDGAGLSPALHQEFLKPHSNKQPGIDWGLGVQLLHDLDEDGEFAIMHGGGDYGIKTIAVMLPKSKRGLLIFTNSENGMVLWRKVLEEYLGSVGAEIVRRNLGKVKDR